MVRRRVSRRLAIPSRLRASDNHFPNRPQLMPRAKKVLIRIHYVLLIAGCSTLAYCASVAITASHYQAWAREELRNSNSTLAALSARSSSGRPSVHPPVRLGSGMTLVGRVDVPRIQLSAMVAEGATSQVLRVAVGHVPGTALPWQSGNVSLVAHRDSFFRRLGELKAGDVIRMTVPGMEYNYRVTFTDVVNPDETWVLQPATGGTLTLVTCYPFHFVGRAPKRFVVRARRSDRD